MGRQASGSQYDVRALGPRLGTGVPPDKDDQFPDDERLATLHSSRSQGDGCTFTHTTYGAYVEKGRVAARRVRPYADYGSLDRKTPGCSCARPTERLSAVMPATATVYQRAPEGPTGRAPIHGPTPSFLAPQAFLNPA